MTLSVPSHKKREGELKLGLGSSPPLPLPAQVDAVRQRLALGSCDAGVTHHWQFGHQLGCGQHKGQLQSRGAGPGTPLPDTLSLAESIKIISQTHGQGATSPPSLLGELQAQLLPFSTSLSRLKSFCCPIKMVIKMTTTTIKHSQQLSQLVLHTSWLPAAHCHGAI